MIYMCIFCLTTGVTVIDKPLWLLLTPATDSEQNVFSCWILILDLSMTPMLGCWAALAQALTQMKEMTRLLLLLTMMTVMMMMIMKIFALEPEPRGGGGGSVTNNGESNPCFNPHLAGLQQRLDKTSLKHHCTNAVPLKRYWNEATVTAKLL